MNTRNFLTLNIPSKLAFLSLFCLTSLLYLPVLKDLVNDWSNDPNYSHGFIIPFMSAYLIWEMKNKLASIEIKPSFAGVFVVVFGVLFYYLGDIAAELFTMRCSLIIVIFGLIIFNLGFSYFRLLFFPVLFLILMIPLPAIVFNKIAFPLQLLAAKSATFSLQICDIPVLRDGNVIHLSTTVLEVAEACSGIRSLISLITLGIIFAHFTHDELWKKAVLVLSTVPIAIFANGMRVSGTGILAHYFGEDVAQGFYHSFAGFLVFGVALLLLLVEDAILFRLLPKFLERR